MRIALLAMLLMSGCAMTDAQREALRDLGGMSRLGKPDDPPPPLPKEYICTTQGNTTTCRER